MVSLGIPFAVLVPDPPSTLHRPQQQGLSGRPEITCPIRRENTVFPGVLGAFRLDQSGTLFPGVR